jgi:hypothetical protein
VARWLAVVIVALAGCKTVAKGEIYEELIRQRLAEVGEPDADVDCPDELPLGRVVDNRFDCVLLKDGRSTPVELQIGASHLQWKLTPK